MLRTRYIPILIFAIILLTQCSCRKSNFTIDQTETITDDGGGIGTTTWTKDKTYVLDGFVFVNDGQTLTIEAGTVIKAKTGQGENASAIIVARGGKIIAEGSAFEPIIFTVEGDDLKGSVPVKAKGLWGGLILLGNAQVNTENGEDFIEGIPISEPRGVYGGFNDDDNSGILRYVSIRHGGTNIGEGNEINGLTLGGVGRKTIIDHIEVISNSDDGVEFFGGTVNCRYLVAAFCEDDAYDFDEGFQGKGQFWLAIQDQASGDNLAEHDGGTDPITGQPYTVPEIYNATFIGRGAPALNNLILFIENAGGRYLNSIFLNQTGGVLVEYCPDRQCSWDQYKNKNLEFKNNIFFNVANDTATNIFNVVTQSGDDISDKQAVFEAYFQQGNNSVEDPGLEILSGAYAIIPQNDVSTNMATYPGTWFKEVAFKGAFGEDNWLSSWTLLDESGFVK